jgi:hypothetical protein
MSSKNYTAVESLDIMLLGVISFDSEKLRKKYKKILKQAIEMEREQIMIAASHAHFEGGNYKMSGLELFEYGFKYYIETYGQ